jgi:uncharacterized protein
MTGSTGTPSVLAPAAAKVSADETIVRETVQRLVKALHPERIYLFGSRARGDARPDSDYDLLVVVREREGPGLAMEQRAHQAIWDVGAAADVVIVTDDYYRWMLGAKASLPATVEREGRLLYAA